jgi:hypothetical protein
MLPKSCKKRLLSTNAFIIERMVPLLWHVKEVKNTCNFSDINKPSEYWIQFWSVQSKNEYNCQKFHKTFLCFTFIQKISCITQWFVPLEKSCIHYKSRLGYINFIELMSGLLFSICPFFSKFEIYQMFMPMVSYNKSNGQGCYYVQKKDGEGRVDVGSWSTCFWAWRIIDVYY